MRDAGAFDKRLLLKPQAPRPKPEPTLHPKSLADTGCSCVLKPSSYACGVTPSRHIAATKSAVSCALSAPGRGRSKLSAATKRRCRAAVDFATGCRPRSKEIQAEVAELPPGEYQRDLPERPASKLQQTQTIWFPVALSLANCEAAVRPRTEKQIPRISSPCASSSASRNDRNRRVRRRRPCQRGPLLRMLLVRLSQQPLDAGSAILWE
jgi:hypothetical protein